MTRAFVIANGPSIKSMDLSKLKNEVTFGSNTIFDNECVPFSVTYYFCLDNLLSIMLRHQILKYMDNDDIKVGYILPSHKAYFQHPKIEYYGEPKHPVGIWMMYKALGLGYNPVYLVGMDLNFKLPPISELNRYLKAEDLLLDEETIKIFSELKDVIRMKNVVTFKEDVDGVHGNDYLAKNKIPFHYAITSEVVQTFNLKFGELTKENRDKVFNAGIGGNCNIARVDFESLFGNE